MTLAKDIPTMLDHLEQLYMKRHPDWTQKRHNYSLRSVIRDLAVRELYATSVEPHGSFERALEEEF
jgi:hypothetical protein